jgi:DNA repair exonuclease SbcCD nuclease subunit
VKIANPIYDAVFKHLMENQEIATGLVSRLIGVEVLSLVPQAQELTHQHAQFIGDEGRPLHIYRLDFSAQVRLADGSIHQVLIELQKAQSSEVIGRFRGYIGTHYAKPTPTVGDSGPLPIIAIYILGFILNHDLPKVTKVKRQYLDGVTGETLTTRDRFIESLTHDAVIVQIPKLNDTVDTDIERALALFDQRYQAVGNPHFLMLNEQASQDQLVQQMLRTLLAAASDEATQISMGLEDEVVRILDAKTKAEDEAKVAIAELQKAEVALQTAAKERDEAAKERDEVAKRLAEAAKERDEAAKERDEAARERDEANQNIAQERSQKEAAERRIALLEEMLRSRDASA